MLRKENTPGKNTQNKSVEQIADEFGAMYLEEKMTVRQIAKETGYSQSTIRKYLSWRGYYKR